MDLRLALTTFVAVFLGELADKTQLITMSISASAKSRWSVFVGSALALVCASAIGVLAGGIVGRVIPLHWLKRGAGTLFVLIGLVTLWSGRRP
jgi:Ca2+/H+ antiporter, TMEM165/GDT1 family